MSRAGGWTECHRGGSGVCSPFGGFVAENFGRRHIFFASIAVALAGLSLIHGTPESKAETKGSYQFDLAGVRAFMVAMIRCRSSSPRATPSTEHYLR